MCLKKFYFWNTDATIERIKTDSVLCLFLNILYLNCTLLKFADQPLYLLSFFGPSLVVKPKPDKPEPSRPPQISLIALKCMARIFILSIREISVIRGWILVF